MKIRERARRERDFPEQPRYLRIDGHWYVLKSHVAEQMERLLLEAALRQMDRDVIKIAAVSARQIDLNAGAINLVTP